MKGREKGMTEIRNIIQRLRMGHGIRRIHKELGVYRPIVRELHNLAVAQQWLNTDLPMPSDEEIARAKSCKTADQSHPLDVHKEQLEQWDKEGLTSVVIQQLLKEKCLYDVQVIRRYRAKHFLKSTKPVMVRTTAAGRDLELDFGDLGRFLDDDNVLKKVWLFSLRLRHSRKAYREIVLNQTIPTFLKGHVHAFEYFNGVPQNCILDNLKAGVTKSTIDNDMINRSYQELAEHYGFIISPCLPRTPEHKGGIEGDVKYVKKNFLSYFLALQKSLGIQTPKIRDLTQALEKWDKDVADVHLIHGVDRSPLDLFNSEEQKALLPLPKMRWEPTRWVQCIVRREWRIMIDSAYYSVPFHLIDKTVEACITSLFVRIFHENKEVALHELATAKWEYKRKAEHAPPFQEEVLQCSRDGLLSLAKDIGPFTYQVADAILSHPHLDKLRPVRHLLRLGSKYSQERLEKACERAARCKLFSYASVKNILENNLDSQVPDLQRKSTIIPFTSYRFARNANDYRSESFETKLERLHPTSKHGNAMAGVFNALLADRVVEDVSTDAKLEPIELR